MTLSKCDPESDETVDATRDEHSKVVYSVIGMEDIRWSESIV